MPTTAMMIEALVALRHEPGGVPADHFWQLVERFRADLLNQAFGILGNQADAEDAAQSALAKAFRLLPTLKDPQKLGIWLRQVNKRVALNILRTRRRSKVFAVPVDTGAHPAVNPPSESSGAADHVAGVVDTLPEHYREVVVLRYWERLTTEQIAVRLGVPQGTVKSRIARADRMLLEKLRPAWSKDQH